jgi:uncharacterized Zn-finger protein
MILTVGVLRLWSTGLWHHVVLYVDTKNVEGYSVFVFKVDSEDGGSMFLHNVVSTCKEFLATLTEGELCHPCVSLELHRNGRNYFICSFHIYCDKLYNAKGWLIFLNIPSVMHFYFYFTNNRKINSFPFFL